MKFKLQYSLEPGRKSLRNTGTEHHANAKRKLRVFERGSATSRIYNAREFKAQKFKFPMFLRKIFLVKRILSMTYK